MENKLIDREIEIIKFWRDQKIFEKSLKQTEGSEIFSFYDGPPFATGLPHYGHLVAGLMKDVVPRYQTMKGKYVSRRWGWDCHGLPIENLIEQELGVKDKKEIEADIKKFNQECQNCVLRYASEWRKTVERMGRWVDMDNDYKTMDSWYMESIWWVFKSLWEKKLIYQGYKSMHICPRCGTTLSNFEVTQNYKDITDLSAIAKFELVDEPGTYILAWTTTPWTLPGNVALAVGPRIDYVKVEFEGKKYILAKANVEQIFEGREFKIVSAVKAKDLESKKYKPLFDYFVSADLENKAEPSGSAANDAEAKASATRGSGDGWQNIYTIQLADFVTVEDGTGVVHIAPGFGEDDMNLGKEKNLPMIKHVDPTGRFTSEVRDFAGEPVKPKEDTQAMDVKIVEYLDKKGLIFAQEKFNHSYPLCWRCDTPLLNYATSSWFVRVTEIKKDLIKNNEKINWVPPHLKEGRFGRWLEEAKDWAISRSRYWGAPLPVWQADDGEQICVGSVEELERLSGRRVEDLHKHVVDEIIINKDGKEYKRIPEVLDCWFESGSMPYAQQHYPFENKDVFKAGFPADFIAEGIDQTRGWFYTLLVLSTALFGKSPYRNVIANGIVLAEDGNKMSKRLKNYPEPDEVMDKYGADALRFYLLSSPVMEGENLNFSESGVKESMQKVVMLLDNVLSFYKLYAGNKESGKFETDNILDRWILSKLNLLVQDVTEAMEAYYLVKAVRPIQEFINELSTWYVRRSRDRFKSGDQNAVATLGYVLLELSKVMAPFTPFVADYVYRGINKASKESVHLDRWPEVQKKLIDEKLLEEMELARQIVEKGLAARAEAGIKVRQPLSSYTTSLAKQLPEDIIQIVKEELNIKKLNFGKDEIDTELTNELKMEGETREIIRQINQLRKESGLTIDDKVIVYYEGLVEIFSKFGAEIKKATLADEIAAGSTEKMKEVEGGKIGIKKI